MRHAGAAAYTTEKSPDASEAICSSALLNSEDISLWTKEAVVWVNAKGLIVGAGDSTRNPGENADRADCGNFAEKYSPKYPKMPLRIANIGDAVFLFLW